MKANQKIQRFNTRAELSDLDRFRVMVARKQRSYDARKLAFKRLGGKSASKKTAAKGKK